MRIFFIVILSVLIFLVCCEKAEEYSEIPSVKYKSFVFDTEYIKDFKNQVGYLTFEFVDGNGDIGFAENSDSITSIEIPDVFLYKYKKIDGNFILTDTTISLLPYFVEGVYRKYIRGEMEIKIYFINQINDTIRYDFQIMDRQYHLSNLESTPELVVPEWN